MHIVVEWLMFVPYSKTVIGAIPSVGDYLFAWILHVRVQVVSEAKYFFFYMITFSQKTRFIGNLR